MSDQTTHDNASDAVKQGQADAIENSKSELKDARANEKALEDNIKDAKDTARENVKVEKKNQTEPTQTELKNDTSDKAKIDTTKAQLDPTGTDPNVSDADIKAAALDGENVKPGTSVTNKEAARRSATSDEPTEQTKDAAGNPTLGHGETNVPADTDAAHPGGGKADGSSKSK